MCAAKFEDGVVYPHQDLYYDARRYIRIHIATNHGSVLDYLLGLGKKSTGITDHQRHLIEQFARGKSDAEIVADTGGSASTIRAQRFQLRERAKQARVFLAIMNLVEAHVSGDETFVAIHRGAKMVDERYMTTESERQKVLQDYFPHGLDGTLKTFPRKEKRKLIILRNLAERFQVDHRYTEKEVNTVLKAAFSDYVTLRRYLIEYGFMDREDDGSAYWLRA